MKSLFYQYVTSAFTSEQEFSSQLEKLRSLMPKQREPICRDISPKVADCYAANPTQVLKCSDLVKDFARCVEKNIGMYNITVPVSHLQIYEQYQLSRSSRRSDASVKPTSLQHPPSETLSWVSQINTKLCLYLRSRRILQIIRLTKIRNELEPAAE